MLKVAPTLVLPLDAITQRIALLAVSGAGKSNAARVMAEEFFKAELPFVAIDPKGDWWGMRAGADGKPKGGLDVAIFGGKHGDVPLERTGGKLVADIIVEQRLSSILDLSLFEHESDRKHFLYEFGKRLYFRNEDPLHLFFEECDDYLPQKPMKDELKLLRVYENIVRRGRTKGLGITLISQRSAVVNKNVLTQAETLFALRTTGPQDINAIEGWMKHHGGDSEMLKTLPELEDGEFWVFSPHFLKKTGRHRFRMSHTFDSGATPKNRTKTAKRKPATLSDIDVSALSQAMAETIERAAAEDPKLLRQRISELEKQLKKPAAVAVAKVERVEVPTFTKADQKLLERVSTAATSLSLQSSELAKKAAALNVQVSELGAKVKTSRPAPTSGSEVMVSVRTAARKIAEKKPLEEVKVLRRVERQAGFAEGGLGKCARALLAVLVQHGGMPLEEAAIIARYSPRSSNVINSAAQLRGLGLIEGANVRMEATAVGSGHPELSTTSSYPIGKPLAEYWAGKVGKCGRALLEVAIERFPSSVALEDAAKEANPPYSPKSSNVVNSAAKLRKLTLVKGSNAAMTANPLLMG